MNCDSGVNVKRKLSAHVQQRMAIVPCEKPSNFSGDLQDNAALLDNNTRECSQQEEISTSDDGGRCHKKKTPSGGSSSNASRDDSTVAGTPIAIGTPTGAPATGSFNAGPLALSNSILGEVLNEKKLALLRSPEVIKFLQEQHRKISERK